MNKLANMEFIRKIEINNMGEDRHFNRSFDHIFKAFVLAYEHKLHVIWLELLRKIQNDPEFYPILDKLLSGYSKFPKLTYSSIINGLT